MDRWSRQPAGDSDQVIARLRAEVEGSRGQREELPHEEFLAYLKHLMEGNRDPELHAAIWDFREGRTTRSMLEADPDYQRAMASDFTESLHALGPERLEQVRAEGAAYLESEARRRGER